MGREKEKERERKGQGIKERRRPSSCRREPHCGGLQKGEKLRLLLPSNTKTNLKMCNVPSWFVKVPTEPDLLT